MPLKYNDLIKWEEEQDIDKFHQILRFLNEDEYTFLRSYSVDVLDRLHHPDSLRMLIGINHKKINQELSNKIKKVIVNWGEPTIEFLQDHIKKSTTKFNAKQSLLTLGEIDDDRVISYLIEIIFENFRKFEFEARDILQKKLSFHTLIDKYNNNDAKIRYAVVKAATSYPIFEKTENTSGSEPKKLNQAQVNNYDNCRSDNEREFKKDTGLLNPKENIHSGKLEEIFKFFVSVAEDENVIVRFAGIAGLVEEFENAKSDKKGRNEKEVFPHLRDLLLIFLNDEDFYIKQIAIEYLGLFNEDDFVYQELKKIFVGRENLFLKKVLLSLGQFKKEELIEEFAAICLDQNQEESIRLAVVKALRQIPDEKTLQVLKHIIESESDTFLKFETIKSLEFYNPKDTIDILVPLLDDEKRNFKLASIICISRQNDPVWKNHVLTFLEKNDYVDLIFPAVDYLQTVRDDRAKIIILEKIVKLKSSGNINNYFWVLRTLLGEQSKENFLEVLSSMDDAQIQQNLEKYKSVLTNL